MCKIKMTSKHVLLEAVCVGVVLLAPFHLLAQAPSSTPPSIITMNKEPHHHPEMHNEYVNVLTAKVAPGDSVLLHRHDRDAVAIAIGNQQVTFSAPGKPDVPQTNLDGQVRIQPSGYIHSTHVDGPDAYFTVVVELLHEQTGKRNLCAAVIVGQPLNCPEASSSPYSPNEIIQPQFASDQMRIELVRILPHQSVEIGHWTVFQFIVVLDPASISPASGEGPDQMLRPGDFVWFDMAKASRKFKNTGDSEVRFVELQFNPISSSGQLPPLPDDRPSRLASRN
jgi:quercetin dioxygenase-like cupin family protein